MTDLSFYKTPTREHFFRHIPTQSDGITLVTLYPDNPGIERMAYEPGMLTAWGCVAATAEEFDTAYAAAELALKQGTRTETPAEMADFTVQGFPF